MKKRNIGIRRVYKQKKEALTEEVPYWWIIV